MSGMSKIIDPLDKFRMICDHKQIACSGHSDCTIPDPSDSFMHLHIEDCPNGSIDETVIYDYIKVLESDRKYLKEAVDNVRVVYSDTRVKGEVKRLISDALKPAAKVINIAPIYTLPDRMNWDKMPISLSDDGVPHNRCSGFITSQHGVDPGQEVKDFIFGNGYQLQVCKDHYDQIQNWLDENGRGDEE